MSTGAAAVPALAPVLLEAAARRGDRDLYAFAELDRPVTTGEFARLAGRGASALAALGVGPGDRVAVWAENSLAWLVLLAAAAWRGAALVTLHPALTTTELADALSRSRPRQLFVAERVRDRAGPDAARAAGGADGPGVHVLTDDLGRDAMAGLPGWSDDTPDPAVDPDAVVNIQFTSGSTGRPKMVALSGRNLIRNAEATAAAAGVGGGDRLVAPLPLAHAAGVGSGAILAMATGALWVSGRRFEPAAVLDQIRAHRATVLQMVPTMATMLADAVEREPGRWDLSSLRVGFVGGAACQPALRLRTVRVLELDRLAVVYGQTEAGPTISIDPGDASCSPTDRTVGRVLPCLEARVVVPGTDVAPPPGTAGELLVRGTTVGPGYVDDPAATASTIATDGWLRTGDIGVLDADRVLTLYGRTTEMIIRGGENVDPAEVEGALLEDPAVVQACVLGVPSTRWGERVGALLVAASDTGVDLDLVCSRAAGRLATHKVPTVLRAIDRLPLLPSGKVDRRAAAALLDGVAPVRPAAPGNAPAGHRSPADAVLGPAPRTESA